MANTRSLDLELSSSQYASCNDNAALDITTTISIEAWIKPESLQAVTYNRILSKGSTLRNYDFLLEANGKLGFYYLASGSVWHGYLTNAIQVSTGVWTHVAMTYTFGTAGSMVVYVNGSAVAGAW